MVRMPYRISLSDGLSAADGSGLRLLGGIADDVLHLLYEYGEHAAERLGVRVVDGELLLEASPTPLSTGFRHVAAVGEDDALPVQRGAQVQEIGTRASVAP